MRESRFGIFLQMGVIYWVNEAPKVQRLTDVLPGGGVPLPDRACGNGGCSPVQAGTLEKKAAFLPAYLRYA